jgi:hypothetical protein
MTTITTGRAGGGTGIGIAAHTGGGNTAASASTMTGIMPGAITTAMGVAVPAIGAGIDTKKTEAVVGR